MQANQQSKFYYTRFDFEAKQIAGLQPLESCKVY
jgi:hypothetical protein